MQHKSKIWSLDLTYTSLLSLERSGHIPKLESSHSPQVPPPRQSYSPGGVTIFALPAVPLCPL